MSLTKSLTLLFTSALMISSLTACQAGSTRMPLAVSPLMQAQASTRVVYHVVPEGRANVWHVKLQRNPQPVSTHRTKEEAIVAGRAIAKSNPLGQLIVHKANGQIETEYTYGNDPAHSAG